ncbi:ester cyclase [Arcobacter sp. YIC-464]|uniref:ester cyclase n=1 Tax=Arcobacter sp. YIC-464 TaxID=3376631 RepID=UPI003C2800FF
MKNLTNKDLVKLYYEELWNKKNKEFIDILFDDNISFHGSLGVEANGKEEFASYMDMIHEGIPSLFHSIIDMVVDNNSIAVRALYTGKHTGKLFEYEASDNRILYNGATFFKFSENKIKSVWVLGDLNTLVKQLQKA